ncbi:NAD(P)-binding protein [Lentinus tigrinus ALCF2SS1-7]|uniref:NAD(P)-binding protein n=1 Tax=Lentinus tigrinus ALCF2SS1-6 TaxID=1328759 RepID=A0A5C2RXA8_9APHY|nr:NAD(P)-binding protein [Lentinus tigrinus ALCF2SS1-6]RPD69092.1 NAD(P)-binding protein [Lentinus tigrinus ALCF2SS1-7]
MQKIINKVKSKETFDYSTVAESDLQGRTALVTGGTQGIGFEIAHALALAKARVLVLSRMEENGANTVATIKKEDPTVDINFIECDLGNLKMVKDVADNIRETEKRLDLLICDAGVGVNAFALTANGIDRHFGVNYLGHYLLINHLLPLLQRTAALPSTPAPRIVSVSSELHRTAPSSVSFANIPEVTSDIGLGPNGYYARSKLALILFTKYGVLHRVFKPNSDRILALAVHPGGVHTNQPEQFKEAYGKVMGTFAKAAVVPLMRSPENSSLSALWAATSEDVEKQGWNGHYFTEAGKVSEESKQAQDEELRKNLWVLSEKLVTEKMGSDALLSWDAPES